MRLLSLELFNFRVFYNEHRFDFSASPEKAVTVVTGFNGGGKTTLLNAIYWCLTGHLTPRFKQPTRLVNFDAYKENKDATAYCETKFEEDGVTYRARRTTGPRQIDQSFTVYKLDKYGASTVIQSPQIFIQKFIPKGLAEWFFYDAEAIGELKLSGSDDFRKSLRKTFGFELVDNLIADLEVCESRKQRDLNKSAGSVALDKLLTDIEYFKTTISNDQISLELDKTRLEDAKKLFTEKDLKLRQQPETKTLTRDRNEYEKLLVSKNESLKRLVKERKVYEGQAIPALIVYKLAKSLKSMLKLKEEKGQLPSNVTELLLSQILDTSQCICGTPVLAGSKEESSLKDLFKNASSTVFSNRVMNLQLLINDISLTCEEYPNKIISLRSDEVELNNEISQIEIKLKSIKEQIDQIPTALIATIENEREKALNERVSLESAVKNKQEKITSWTAKLAILQKQYTEESQKVDVKSKVKRELITIQTLLNFTKNSLKNQEIRALNVLSIELNMLISKFLIKPYKAIVDPNTYKITLLDDKNVEVPESTGEDAVLKYVFLATVASLTGKKTIEKIEFMSEPITAPLVLDAPFTSLSDPYKLKVASNLVNQASQLILFVLPDVLPLIRDAIKDYIGQEYVLISRLRGPQDDKEILTTSINNKEYVLNEYNCEHNDTYAIKVNI